MRHTFASLAGDLGFSELTIAALLGHSARGVTQRYIHIDEALRMTADRVAAEMADILDGRATPSAKRLAHTRPDLAHEVCALVDGCLAEQPETRPTADALVVALASVAR